MSMLFAPLPTTTDNDYFQGAWRRFFGRFIESGREKAGLSIEQAAALAAMTTVEWTAIEAGCSMERPAFSRPLSMNLPKKRRQAPWK